MSRGLTAEDISVKTKIVHPAEVKTYCDICDLLQPACILVQNWHHGPLYVCPECRQMACIKTDNELADEQIERQKRRNHDAEESLGQTGKDRG